jgi:hypothetical protein
MDQQSGSDGVRQSIRRKPRAPGNSGAGGGGGGAPGIRKGEQERRHAEVLVDFSKIERASLLRYKKYFGLVVSPTASKKELLAAVKKHFAHHPRLRDAEVISDFLYRNKKAQERSLKPLH